MKIIRYIALYATLIALTLVFSLVEALYMPSMFIPGVKLGIANIIIVLVLYLFSFWDALIISIIRVFLTSLITGTIFQMGFVMSLTGALLSLIVMWLLKLFLKRSSVIFVSIIGSFCHVLGQVVVAIIYLQNVYIVYYFPLIGLFSILSGFVIGLVCYKLIKNKTLINLSDSFKSNKKASS